MKEDILQEILRVEEEMKNAGTIRKRDLERHIKRLLREYKKIKRADSIGLST